MERFITAHKATLVAIAVFVFLAWFVGRPAIQKVWDATHQPPSARDYGLPPARDWGLP